MSFLTSKPNDKTLDLQLVKLQLTRIIKHHLLTVPHLSLNLNLPLQYCNKCNKFNNLLLPSPNSSSTYLVPSVLTSTSSLRTLLHSRPIPLNSSRSILTPQLLKTVPTKYSNCSKIFEDYPSHKSRWERMESGKRRRGWWRIRE